MPSYCAQLIAQFDGDNPFDPIKSMNTISNVSSYNPDKHGILFAVIRCFTPYHDRAGHGLW